LNYVALGLLIFVFVFVFYAITIVHDIPYKVAENRNHPQQDAIHVAGWVSLMTLHIIWPFLWIWAMLYREDRGWGIRPDGVVPEGGKIAAVAAPPTLEPAAPSWSLALTTGEMSWASG
jgi:hypothetical protein